MNRKLFRSAICCIALGTLSLNSFSQDSEKITRLEREIEELKHRISKLEAPQSNSVTSSRPSSNSDGWRSLANWRALRRGMGYEEVKRLLGEPSRVDGGGLTVWYYPNSSQVMYMHDKLAEWREPR